MCRNVNVTLLPVPIADLFLAADGRSGNGEPRSREEIQASLDARFVRAHAISEDCTKKSTRAGYDAGGMAVGVVHLPPLSKVASEGATSVEELDGAVDRIHDLETRVRFARKGGDLLYTWDSLVERLQLEPMDFVVSWECHVRQASQGDMYSEANAHPQYEELASEDVRIYHLDPGGDLTSRRQPWSFQGSLFFDTHNGDINDATQYKLFLEDEGYRFVSNSDSCVEP